MEITALTYCDTDAIDKHSSLKKTFLKKSYYQFFCCFYGSNAVIS